jgi:hypothetical protein
MSRQGDDQAPKPGRSHPSGGRRGDFWMFSFRLTHSITRRRRPVAQGRSREVGHQRRLTRVHAVIRPAPVRRRGPAEVRPDLVGLPSLAPRPDHRPASQDGTASRTRCRPCTRNSGPAEPLAVILIAASTIRRKRASRLGGRDRNRRLAARRPRTPVPASVPGCQPKRS